jgi:hypothetical protein
VQDYQTGRKPIQGDPIVRTHTAQEFFEPRFGECGIFKASIQTVEQNHRDAVGSFYSFVWPAFVEAMERGKAKGRLNCWM